MTDKLVYDDAYIRGILKRVRTIAAVGMSANDMRPSYFAMLYLQRKGYRMIPINPRYAGEAILGETVLAALDDLPEPPDMVQIFRRAEETPAAVDDAIRAGAKVVWLQLGIRSDEAARKAEAAGLDVVMDRCPKIEYGRLFGEIGWAGVNRRVISAKKGQAMQLSRKTAGSAIAAAALPATVPDPTEKQAKKGSGKGRKKAKLRLKDCINDTCPWSGKPVQADSLMRYQDQVVGFCNPGCRDKFEQAVTHFGTALTTATKARKREKRC
jgi:predicted CoA-binding protein